MYIALTIVFTVVGQILVKQGMTNIGGAPAEAKLLPAYALRAFTHARVLIGLGSAFVAAFWWTLAVSKTPLSLAYPFMGLAIVLVLVLSGALLGEHVKWNQWLGVAFVCVGIWLAAQK